MINRERSPLNGPNGADRANRPTEKVLQRGGCRIMFTLKLFDQFIESMELLPLE